MTDRRNYITAKAVRNDIYSVMRKYLGKSSDRLDVWTVHWTDNDNGWLVEFSDAFEFDIYQVKELFANSLIVGERALVIGVRRG